MIITIDLEIENEPLLGRRCFRCDATEFREIAFQKHPDSDVIGSDNCQSSIHLAICMNCKRLVTFQ